MNKKKKIAQMRRFINKHGKITDEHKRPPDKSFSLYRRGSYFISFVSEELDISYVGGDVNKYEAYKSLFKEIKEK